MLLFVWFFKILKIKISLNLKNSGIFLNLYQQKVTILSILLQLFKIKILTHLDLYLLRTVRSLITAPFFLTTMFATATHPLLPILDSTYDVI